MNFNFKILIYTVVNILADYAVCDWWFYCKALCAVMFSQTEGNGRKFIEQSNSVFSYICYQCSPELWSLHSLTHLEERWLDELHLSCDLVVGQPGAHLGQPAGVQILVYTVCTIYMYSTVCVCVFYYYMFIPLLSIYRERVRMCVKYITVDHGRKD